MKKTQEEVDHDDVEGKVSIDKESVFILFVIQERW